MNPLVVVRTEIRDNAPVARSLWLWCPGCEQAHAPRAALEDGSKPGEGPYWDWNGATDETFTISPSLLCHGSVHLCPPDYEHRRVCPNPDSCGSSGHLIMDDEQLGHMLDHVVEPAWGSCHSFIRQGHWQFLGDCAHRLAGQTVPMVPVPDWLAT